jgi:hypothetical protein
MIVDEDRASAMLILDSWKNLQSGKNSLRIVFAHHQTALGGAFSTRTHLVIYKAISLLRRQAALLASAALRLISL